MDQQTLMTLLGIATFALALFSYLGVIRRDLKREIGRVDHRLTGVRDELKADINGVDQRLTSVRDELKADINATRTDLKDDIAQLDRRMVMIEQHTYDLRGLLSPVAKTAESS